jgi:hypothetical protein
MLYGEYIVARLSACEQSILTKYTRAVVHMRRQIDEHRFGLVFGAGIGNDLKLPSWNELIERIADHPKVLGRRAIQGVAGLDQSLTIQIQKLFEFYRLKASPPAGRQVDMFRHREKQLIADWRRIVTECLYETVEHFTPDGIAANHPYLGAYAKVIGKCDVTINYNFDETLQVLLSGESTPLSQKILKFKTVSKGIMRPSPHFSR